MIRTLLSGLAATAVFMSGLTLDCWAGSAKAKRHYGRNAEPLPPGKYVFTTTPDPSQAISKGQGVQGNATVGKGDAGHNKLPSTYQFKLPKRVD